MDYIFSIKDKTGREIYLSREKWNHICQEHPEINNKLEDIIKALQNPSLIVVNKFDENKRNYYLFDKEIKRYLLVAVKYLNGKDHISTAFIARNIKKR
jgi:hypothetical protein